MIVAHCAGASWACDLGTAVALLLVVAGIVIGLRRLQRKTEARERAYREAQARRTRSARADEEAPEH
jgi:hypothetical protein